MMTNPMEAYYKKRGKILVQNLQNRHFEAYYCENKEKALECYNEIKSKYVNSMQYADIDKYIERASK